MKLVNDVTSVVFKNNQLRLEGHWSAIRIDSMGQVDIVNITGSEFGGHEDYVVTTDIDTLKQLMEQWDKKIAGRCESCNHYIGNGEFMELTDDGCFLCSTCSENYEE